MNYSNIIIELPENIKQRLGLKPITCQSCKDNGETFSGSCKKCLENQAHNREVLETHLFVYDDRYRSYHSDMHNNIKGLVLRLPNEHPYLYYGVEIEVEFDSNDVYIYNSDDDYDDDNWKIQDILTEFSEITDGMFVYEYDGSLSNGVELISRPTSYAFWTHPDTVDKLKRGLEYLREKGAYIDQPITNGLHIHISRKFFDYGKTKLADRRDAYKGIDWLFQKFQPEIEKIGEREYTGYCSSKAQQLRSSLESNWTLSSYNVDAEIKCTLKKGGDVPCGDHHVAVTLSGNTIEARVFKSTTDYKRVLAYIEIMRNMAHAVRDDNIEVSFNSLLHTKENQYLDEVVRQTRLNCAKNKTKLDLEKVNDNCIEVVVVKESLAR